MNQAFARRQSKMSLMDSRPFFQTKKYTHLFVGPAPEPEQPSTAEAPDETGVAPSAPNQDWIGVAADPFIQQLLDLRLCTQNALAIPFQKLPALISDQVDHHRAIVAAGG